MTIIKIGKSNTYKLFCHCNICLFHDKMSQRKDTKDATAKRSCQNLERDPRNRLEEQKLIYA